MYFTTKSFHLSLPPLSFLWSRKLFPQGLRSPSLIIPWIPLLQSLLPLPPCPLTAPPGYAAWGLRMVTLVVKLLTTERYFGVTTPVLHSLHFVLVVVCCHFSKTQFFPFLTNYLESSICFPFPSLHLFIHPPFSVFSLQPVALREKCYINRGSLLIYFLSSAALSYLF